MSASLLPRIMLQRIPYRIICLNNFFVRVLLDAESSSELLFDHFVAKGLNRDRSAAALLRCHRHIAQSKEITAC
jgi:hypothetical protein